jgi:hypothetical protein
MTDELSDIPRHFIEEFKRQGRNISAGRCGPAASPAPG